MNNLEIISLVSCMNRPETVAGLFMQLAIQIVSGLCMHLAREIV
jgi:hypothetical protein